jgi:serine/threonine protein phosphatase PrpC
VLAALRGASCELASFGDAFAFRAGSPLPLMQQNTILVGSERGPGRIAPARWHTSFERAKRERIALVSDGVINFTPDPSLIPGSLSGFATDLECARELALAALRAGAADNVAVAAFSGDTDV